MLLRTRGVQLNLVAECNIGALEVDRLILAVHLNRNGEEKFQPTVPDVVLVQHKAFNPGRAREHEILPVVPMVRFTRERPALKTLMSLVNSVADLQCPVDAYVSLSQYCRANLHGMHCYCLLLRVN